MKETDFFEFVDAMEKQMTKTQAQKNESAKLKKTNYKIWAINILFAVVILVYFTINASYISYSCKVHKLIENKKPENPLVINYIKDTYEYRVRECEIGSKILFLECTEGLSSWALGRYSDNINQDIASYRFKEMNSRLDRMGEFFR